MNDSFLITGIVLGSIATLYILLYFGFRFIDLYRITQVIKRNSKSFYRAFSRIKSRKKRYAIYAVYAFCRLADDLIDENKDEAGLLRLESELKRYIETHEAKNYIFRSLKRYTKDFYRDYDYKPYFDMIEGQKQDLYFKSFQTMDELFEYCYRVAGTVGLMLTPILAIENYPKLERFAIHLGYAMQLTNILRDIGEDFRMQRVYLPLEVLNQANYALEDLSNGIINDKFIALIDGLSDQAFHYYEDALKDMKKLDSEARLPLTFAIIIYREILNEIKRNQYDVFTKRAIVSKALKEKLIQDYLESSTRSK